MDQIEQKYFKMKLFLASHCIVMVVWRSPTLRYVVVMACEEMACCVRGYHMYKDISTVALEVALCDDGG